MNKVVLCTGGFDPLHGGHIEYFREARKLGTMLVVGINTDSWLERKKGRAFMSMNERKSIISNLKMVDHCVLYDDSDDSSIQAIKNVQLMYPNSLIIFANGGDRTSDNIPELEHFKNDPTVEFAFNVGGRKSNSSSDLLGDWVNYVNESR